jgi:hypothetical protein
VLIVPDPLAYTLAAMAAATREPIMVSAPVGALVVVLVGWALRTVTGGFFAALISRKPPGWHALMLGSLLTFAGAEHEEPPRFPKSGLFRCIGEQEFC